MKNPKGNYMKMPKSLITGYKLTQGELFLYYALKEFEERFYAGKQPKQDQNQFFVSDDEILQLIGVSHNSLAKYKRGLKEKGLIRVRKRKDSRCDYLLLELYHE